MPVIEKCCSKCKRTMSANNFYKAKINPHNKTGLQPYCIKCSKLIYQENREHRKQLTGQWQKKHPEKVRGYKLKHRHNLTIKQYDKMFVEQSGKCAICDKHQSKLKQALHIDHNHSTGKIRKLLCRKCNLLIGNCEENIGILKNAIKYVEKYNGSN